MRRAVPVLGLVVLALLLAPSVSAREEVGSEDRSVRVEGQTLDLDTSDVATVGCDSCLADAAATATLVLDDTELALKGPRCSLGDSTAPECTGGTVTYATGLRLDNVNVVANVGLIAPRETSTAGAGVPSARFTSGGVEVPPATLVLVAAAGAAISSFVLYGLWRALKWGVLGVGLYTHIADNELLDDANRARIYALIKAEPGISTKDIASRNGLAWGTVTHHLLKLERRKFVVSKKYGKYRRYFVNGAAATDEKKDVVAVLKVARTADVAQLIREHPGSTQTEVSNVLGVSSSTILWHVKRLEDVRLIRKVREGKLVRYYPADGMAQATVITPPQPANAA